MSADPLYWFCPGAQSIDTGYTIGEGDDALLNPDRPIVRRDYIDFATKESARPTSCACYAAVRRRRRGRAVGLRCRPRSPTATRCCRCRRCRSTSRWRIPTARSCATTKGKPLRMAFADHGDRFRAHRQALAANGLTGDDCTEASLDQFAKFGYFRTALPTLRPAGRRDGGGAPVLHQPLEHLAGDDQEGRRRQAVAGRAAGTRVRIRCRTARRRGPSPTT